MPANSNRMNKINEELRREISNIISLELKDPHLTGLISVTKAKITPDFKYAKIYVSILNSKNIDKTMQGLKDSAGLAEYPLHSLNPAGRTLLLKYLRSQLLPYLDKYLLQAEGHIQDFPYLN